MSEYTPETYSFIPEFQERILAIILRKPGFLRQYRDVVSRDYWESFVVADLAEATLQHFDAFRRPPDPVELAERIDAQLSERPAKKPHLPLYIEVLQRVWSCDLGTEEWVVEKVVEFGRHQALKRALIESFELLPDKKNHGAMEALVRNALAVGTGLGDKVRFFDERYPALLSVSSVLQRSPIPTGLGPLDVRLGGGLGLNGEFGILHGETGLGKSFLLLAFTAAAALAGYHAHYATLELQEDVVVNRLGRFFSRRSRQQIDADPELAKAKIREVLAMTKGRISYSFHPPKRATVIDIHEEILRSEDSHKRRVDLVVYDYLDRCKPLRARDKDYEEQAETYEYTAGWHQEEGIQKAGWTGSQVNSEGMKADTVRGAHTRGAKAKLDSASIIVNMSQSAEEEKMTPPEMRLFIDKNRNAGRAKVADSYYVMFDQARLVPKEEAGK